MRYSWAAPALGVSELTTPPELASATRSRRAGYYGALVLDPRGRNVADDARHISQAKGFQTVLASRGTRKPRDCGPCSMPPPGIEPGPFGLSARRSAIRLGDVWLRHGPGSCVHRVAAG